MGKNKKRDLSKVEAEFSDHGIARSFVITVNLSRDVDTQDADTKLAIAILEWLTETGSRMTGDLSTDRNRIIQLKEDGSPETIVFTVADYHGNLPLVKERRRDENADIPVSWERRHVTNATSKGRYRRVMNVEALEMVKSLIAKFEDVFSILGGSVMIGNHEWELVVTSGTVSFHKISADEEGEEHG